MTPRFGAGIAQVASVALMLSGCGKGPPEGVSAGGPESPRAVEERDGSPRDQARAILAASDVPRIDALRDLDDRVAAVRPRIDAAMPDATDRERAYLAQRIAIEEALHDMGPGQLSEAGPLVVHLQLLDLWRCDLNGDGTLTDDEATAVLDDASGLAADRLQVLAPLVQFDGETARTTPVDAADGVLVNEAPAAGLAAALAALAGDGAVDDASFVGAYAEALNRRAAAERYAMDRVAAEAFDGDADGVLSPAERGRFADAARFVVDAFGVTLDAPWLHPRVISNLRHEVPGLAWLPEIPLTAPASGSPVIPPLPRPDQDRNADGVIDLSDAFEDAEAMDAFFRDRSRAMLLAGFAGVTSALDEDGNGRLSTDEWERGHRTLPERRWRSLFLRFYDTDRSGVVDDREVADFLRWFRAGSVRADANFDGSVDVTDVRAFVEALDAAEDR